MARMSDPRVAAALAWLKKHSKKSVRDGMARYAIPNDKALGVLMGDIQKLAKQLGRDHALALALWKTDVYEARMLCAYVEKSRKVTPAQMDAQARDFDNWAICDTQCFALWVRRHMRSEDQAVVQPRDRVREARVFRVAGEHGVEAQDIDRRGLSCAACRSSPRPPAMSAIS